MWLENFSGLYREGQDSACQHLGDEQMLAVFERVNPLE
jgi:hypothetical protein